MSHANLTSIYIIRVCITRVFGYLIRSSDARLDVLNNERQEKIEELKRKTNFYSTQALLKRFENSDADGTFEDEPSFDQSHSGQSSVQHSPSAKAAAQAAQAHTQTAPQSPSAPNALQDTSKFAFQPYVPRWYDRILDVLVGEDEMSPKNRYALICANCRNHNGLAQYGESPESVVYICPHCGFKNGHPKKTTSRVDQKLSESSQEDETRGGSNDQSSDSIDEDSEQDLSGNVQEEQVTEVADIPESTSSSVAEKGGRRRRKASP